jgi:hypothetical protein
MTGRCLKNFLAVVTIAFASGWAGGLASFWASPAMAQDRPEGCIIEIWPDYLGPGPQEHHIREKLATDAGEIFAIEFGPLAGEYAKLYLFFLDHDGCERKALIVG